MVTNNQLSTTDITIKNLHVSFPVKTGQVKAVDNISVAFKHGQITGLIGESGCGKSVLGQAILGILPEYVQRRGQIFYRDANIFEDNTVIPNFYGQEFALIPQNPGEALNPLRKIGKQFNDILLTAAINDPDDNYKISLLQFFGLDDCQRVLSAYPHELSGGMLQRVLGAMSICCSPVWLLADEPTKGLDETACAVVYENLGKIKTKKALGMLVITHDLQLAHSLCDTVAVMYAGQLVEYGPHVLTAPKHPYTQAFLAALPENGFQPLPGLPPAPQDKLQGCRFALRCKNSMLRCHKEAPPASTVEAAEIRCFLYA